MTSLSATPTINQDRPSQLNLNQVGTIPSVSGLSVKECGVGSMRQTVLTFDSVSITMTDEAGVIAYGGLKVYDLPDGCIRVLGACADLTLVKSGAGINADFDGDFAVGTATASNNATLTSTEANIIPSTATPQASGGATTAKGISYVAITALTDSTGRTPDNTLANHADLTTYANDAAVIEANISDLGGKINEIIGVLNGTKQLTIDGTDTAGDVYLNFLVDDADQDGGGALLVSGTLVLTWQNLGDK